MVAVAPRRGEIWVARLNPNRGQEMGKTRPTVVLQSEHLTRAGLPTVVVAPLSTQLRVDLEPLRVRIPARDRLLQESYVCVEQVRALDRDRFGEGPLAALTDAEMAAVERALQGILGLL